MKDLFASSIYNKIKINSKKRAQEENIPNYTPTAHSSYSLTFSSLHTLNLFPLYQPFNSFIFFSHFLTFSVCEFLRRSYEVRKKFEQSNRRNVTGMERQVFVIQGFEEKVEVD